MLVVVMMRLRRFSLPESQRLNVLYTSRTGPSPLSLKYREKGTVRVVHLYPQPSGDTDDVGYMRLAHAVSDQQARTDTGYGCCLFDISFTSFLQEI